MNNFRQSVLICLNNYLKQKGKNETRRSYVIDFLKIVPTFETRTELVSGLKKLLGQVNSVYMYTLIFFNKTEVPDDGIIRSLNHFINAEKTLQVNYHVALQRLKSLDSKNPAIQLIRYFFQRPDFIDAREANSISVRVCDPLLIERLERLASFEPVAMPLIISAAGFDAIDCSQFMPAEACQTYLRTLVKQNPWEFGREDFNFLNSLLQGCLSCYKSILELDSTLDKQASEIPLVI